MSDPEDDAAPPDRQAQERLADWRTADREEAATADGSVEQRRAVAKTRRARWGYEDAARAAGDDQGRAPETSHAKGTRVVRRFQEAANSAAALQPNPKRREAEPETDDERDKRVEDEAEIAAELGD